MIKPSVGIFFSQCCSTFTLRIPGNDSSRVSTCSKPFSGGRRTLKIRRESFPTMLWSYSTPVTIARKTAHAMEGDYFPLVEENPTCVLTLVHLPGCGRFSYGETWFLLP